jgi:ATP-dependent RNA helicase DDX56/DBP9
LTRTKTSNSSNGLAALILVPTRELADQVDKAVQGLSTYCNKDVKVVNLAHKVSDAVQKSFLASGPQIVIATPARAVYHMKDRSLSVDKLAHLVIDEADLVLSYGHENDLKHIAEKVPKGVQSMLMSATLTPEVDLLTGLLCNDPITLELDEDDDSKNLTQFIVKCSEDEKFLLLYIIFKLQLVKGKCIIFVTDVDRCYRVKLYLEQFGIRSCVLNSELPVNSRIHIVEEFNKNVYDIIIASDETEIIGRAEDEDGLSTKDANISTEDGTKSSKYKNSSKESKNKKNKKKDPYFGISRGIDFQAVQYVINFDLPLSAKSYTHRIGRTARANESGTAISFVIPKSLHGKHRPTTIPSTINDEAVLESIEASQKALNRQVQPYSFDTAATAPFKYRTADAIRAVTQVAIRDARSRELRRQLLASEKLRHHFEANPEDENALRMDRELRSARVQSHLKHVPEYLLSTAAGANGVVVKRAKEGGDMGYVGSGIGAGQGRRARARMGWQGGKGKAKTNGRKVDVLRTFRTK